VEEELVESIFTDGRRVIISSLSSPFPSFKEVGIAVGQVLQVTGHMLPPFCLQILSFQLEYKIVLIFFNFWQLNS